MQPTYAIEAHLEHEDSLVRGVVQLILKSVDDRGQTGRRLAYYVGQIEDPPADADDLLAGRASSEGFQRVHRVLKDTLWPGQSLNSGSWFKLTSVESPKESEVPDPFPVTVQVETSVSAEIVEPAAEDEPQLEPPTRKVRTREPENQNEYQGKVWNSYTLSSTQKLILMGLAIEFGYERSKTGKAYGKVTKEVANEYLRGHASIGETAARTNLQKLVDLGWLRRLDDKRGGRGGKGRAVYQPTIPL